MSSEDITQNPQERFGDIWLEDASFPAVLPRSTEEVMSVIDWARQSGWRVLPVGRGHHFPSSFSVPNSVLTVVTLARDGVSDPDPRDLVLEAETGVPANLAKELAAQAGFRLEGWPEDYPGTVGGVLCGEKGVSLRHLVLGADIVDGRARCLRFGGRVRKNVAGFDVGGLLLGSRGRMAWLDRVYLKLTPLKAPSTAYRPSSLRTSPEQGTDRELAVANAMDPDQVFLKTFA